MSGETVSITFTAEQQAAINAWQKQQQLADKMIAKLDALGKAGDKAGKKTEAGFGGALGMAGGFAVKLTGIGTAVAGVAAIAGQLKAEYDNLLNRQRTAAGRTIDLAAAQSAAVANLGGNDPGGMTPAMLRGELKRISSETGHAQAVVADVAADALSARGELPASAATGATLAALRMSPHDAEAAKVFAASALDVAKVAGSTHEQALGFGLAVGASSHVVSAKDTAQNVMPGVLAVTQFGDDLQEAGALVSMFTHTLVDNTGAVSRTSATSLAKQLAERLPELADTDARMAAARNDPALQKKIFDGGTFNGKKLPGITSEVASYSTVHDLLSKPESGAVKTYESIKRALPTPAASGELYAKQVKSESESPAGIIAGAHRAGVAAEDAQISADPIGAAAGVIRASLEKNLQASGALDAEQKISLGKFDARVNVGGESPFTVGADIAHKRARDLNKPRPADDESWWPRSYNQGGFAKTQPATIENQEKAGSLEQFAGKLDKQNQLMEEQLKLQKEQLKAQQEANKRPAAPAPMPAPRRTHGSVRPAERRR